MSSSATPTEVKLVHESNLYERGRQEGGNRFLIRRQSVWQKYWCYVEDMGGDVGGNTGRSRSMAGGVAVVFSLKMGNGSASFLLLL